MKKLIATLLTVAMLLSMVGCMDSTQNLPSGSLQTTGTMEPETLETEPAYATEHTVTTVPVQTETLVTEPVETDPVITEPVVTEPIVTEPQETQPQETEPAPTQPTESEATEPEDDMLVRVSEYLPQAAQNLRYATEDNFTGKQLYDFSEAYLRYGTVKRLANVCLELEKQGIGVLIWDAFRPLSTQAMLWEICPDPTFVSNPVTGTCSHSRGSAVDLTLVDLETGALLEMPSDHDDFSALGDHDYSDCSETAAANARLLRSVMEKYGFKSYSEEWWHYSDKDSYDKETYFDPAMDTLWYATCLNFMSLRKRADVSAKSIDRIYPNETLELLGWSEYFALVNYNGKKGYVLSNYIKPVDVDFKNFLDTVEYTTVYTYEMMLDDVAAFAQKYPDHVVVEIIGYSELGRELPVLRIGNPEAKEHVLLHASIHGNEYVTTWVLMALVDYWLDHGILGYGDVCYHIIPMVNPDGVTTAQTQKLTDLQKEIYQRDLQLGLTDLSMEEYAQNWKANGLGVDLNRNFDAGWETTNYTDLPSFALYAGEEPFSAAEAKALRDYTLRYEFGATISYHTMGSKIFCQYGENASTNSKSRKLARVIYEISGYSPIDDAAIGVDAGGYKDWCIDKLSIPSLTVEIGCTRPVDPDREMYSIFYRNISVLPAVAIWVQNN